MNLLPETRIYVVDDDASVRDSIALLLSFHGYRVVEFESAEAFLAAWQPGWSGCVLLDLRLSGMDGLALQSELVNRYSVLPIIFLTGHGDVADARQALRQGATDFLEKPIDKQALLSAVAEALDRAVQLREAEVHKTGILSRIERLTDRERQVLERVVVGRQNRDIATELSISPRTVEVFKARMMEKMQARSVADLIRMWLSSGLAVEDHFTL